MEMTDEDLKFLKRATPGQLMALTNNIPWEYCAMLKIELTQPALTFEQKLPIVHAEQHKWVAAGVAIPSDPAVIERWIETHGADALRHCSECGFQWPALKIERRINFDKKQGFVWLNLCPSCTRDFDHHFDPLKLMKTAAALAKRWQGRSLTRCAEVAQ